ncbi:protein tipE [Bacillus rossius redtenbacheri]|uniref:protein tipE n=1 Tax=Bacillus rossius redtenbacheri TaxID=93214 RepID=UPI002FDD8795
MADEPEIIPQTFLEKLLFYTTAFFVLLGTFSLFAFLFLVPFVIEPAFTTIFMEFEPEAASCRTLDVETRHGVSNCSWSSCREGCTKEVYECTQIRVNYKVSSPPDDDEVASELRQLREEAVEVELHEYLRNKRSTTPRGGSSYLYYMRALRRLVGGPEPRRYRRAIRDYDYPIVEEEEVFDLQPEEPEDLEEERTGLMGNDSEWYYVGAKLFPNVKGCGYPPMLNCTIFLKKYKEVGTNFSCYWSHIDPGLVISDLDMHQVYMNLVYAMGIPIPSFIASVIYLTFAYFKIYNEDEEEALVKDDGDGDGDPEKAGSPTAQLTSGAITPGSEVFREDLMSFGHQLKVAMADEMSRESLGDAVSAIGNSNSVTGNMARSMTTSISASHGPIANV